MKYKKKFDFFKKLLYNKYIKKKRKTAKICFNYPHFWIRKISLGLS